jgi:hypothetical protein
MLETVHFVKSSFFHFGNTKTEVDIFFCENLHKLERK